MADRQLIGFRGHAPDVDPAAFVAEGARLVGRVSLGPRASVWYNAVLRGDIEEVRVGAGSNIQDNAVLHVGGSQPCLVGENVLIGHGAICHGCRIEDGALIGMGAIVLSGAVIGAEALVAAGAVIKENTRVAPRTLWTGNPATEQKTLGPGIRERMRAGTELYRQLAAELAAGRND